MRRAICLPYSVDQNEPSRPVKQLFTIPEHDVTERDRLLKQLFIQHVCEDCEAEDLSITERQDDQDYGDLTVSYSDSMMLFVTFVEE